MQNPMTVEQLKVLPRPYMPRWSAISRWCSDLGMLGRDWIPVLSIYNDGNSRILYYVTKIPPYHVLSKDSGWKMLRDADPRRKPDVSKEKLEFGVDLTVLHWAEGIVYLTLGREGNNKFLWLNPHQLLHVVRVTQGGALKLVVECRPLPFEFFVPLILAAMPAN